MPYQTRSLSSLQARLADRYEHVPFWTAEEARLAINEGLRIWNLLVAQWKGRVVVPTVANQVWYQTPAGILFPLRMDIGTTPLVQTTFYDMDLGEPNWEAETTATGGSVPGTVTLWIPAGFTLFAIWPADPTGALQLSVDGIVPAPILVLPTDFLDLGDEEVHVLLGYALHVLAFKVGGPVFTDTFPLYKAFIAHAAMKNDRLLQVKAFRQLLGIQSKQDSVPGKPSSVPLT
jgi:hypothetical protein